MQIEQVIQTVIHKMEVGAGARYLRLTVLALAILTLAVTYDFRAYRNFSAPEAMDSAQLARNIAEGNGYTTLFIRPFSLYLIQSHNEAGMTVALTNANYDFAKIKTAHPDIANAPVYPLVLAGLMKARPFYYPMEFKKSFWSDNGRFARYQPEFQIAVFNEILLLAVVVLTFLIARKLFDTPVAWLSATLTLGCELLWQFSVSGLSTIFLLVIFLGLAWCVLKIEAAAREAQPNVRQLLAWVLAAGTLIGVGTLTRYAFGWAIIPLIVFLILFSGRRVLHALAALAIFALVITPWIIRNYSVSGTPFGTAGFAVMEGTSVFGGFDLERSVHPDLSKAFWHLTPYFHKLLSGVRGILTDDLPKLGGSWASVLFLAGLLMGFRGLATRRFRYFLLMCLGTFIIVQALGRTELSAQSPEINSENLIVLLAPLVFIYGASFFITFLDQMSLPLLQLRYLIIALFVAVSCLPLISALSPPKTQPVVYPPYYPPEIQQISGWMKPGELMMSDVPWAVAWYGQHQCAWLALDSQDEFFAINDYIKPVQALYLTSETMDGKLFSEWGSSPKTSWGHFIMHILSVNKPPQTFSLQFAAPHVQSGLFLTDRARWETAP